MRQSLLQRTAPLLTIFLLSLLLSIALTACDTTRRVEGGASDNGGGGRVKIGVPF